MIDLEVVNHLVHQIDMFTSPYVFDADQAREMARAGADQLVAHVGLTTSGSSGAGVALTLDEAIAKVMEIAAAGRQVRSDTIVRCGPTPSSFVTAARSMNPIRLVSLCNACPE